MSYLKDVHTPLRTFVETVAKLLKPRNKSAKADHCHRAAEGQERQRKRLIQHFYVGLASQHTWVWIENLTKGYFGEELLSEE